MGSFESPTAKQRSCFPTGCSSAEDHQQMNDSGQGTPRTATLNLAPPS